MDEQFSPRLGIARRDLLRRGALLAGALLWATRVQVFDTGAGARAGAPEPRPSWVALLVRTSTGHGDVAHHRLWYDLARGAWDCRHGVGAPLPRCAGITDQHVRRWADRATRSTCGDAEPLAITVQRTGSRLAFVLPRRPEGRRVFLAGVHVVEGDRARCAAAAGIGLDGRRIVFEQLLLAPGRSGA